MIRRLAFSTRSRPARHGSGRIGEDYFRRVIAVRFDDGFLRRSLGFPAIDDEAIRKLADLADLAELTFQDRTVNNAQLREIAAPTQPSRSDSIIVAGFDDGGPIPCPR
ncbi:MAG: hypothetical protein U0800_16830 [Isosphaeraceae bacterium]